jgi:lysozyme
VHRGSLDARPDPRVLPVGHCRLHLHALPGALMDFVFGIDTSWCQGPNIDFGRARDEGGVHFVIEKITEGLTGVDPNGRSNIVKAKAAGLVTGLYHFARVSQGNAIGQVKALWDACGDQLPDLPVALDLESAPDGMTSQQIIAFAEAFAQEVATWFGRLPMIYTFPYFDNGRLQPALASSELLGRCPLWMAGYTWDGPGVPPSTAHPLVTKPWGAWTMWQYSAEKGARVPGIPTPVDRNVFAGGEASFAAFRGVPVPSQLEPDAPIIHAIPDLGST